MINKQGNGVQVFWKCPNCTWKIVTNIEEFGETWWDNPPKHEEIPETCPHCDDEHRYIENATIDLIEVFYEWGYKQWSPNIGWRIKIEIGR